MRNHLWEVFGNICENYYNGTVIIMNVLHCQGSNECCFVRKKICHYISVICSKSLKMLLEWTFFILGNRLQAGIKWEGGPQARRE